MASDGGPAFPHMSPLFKRSESGDITPLGFEGMSLRAYFASQAMIGLLSRDSETDGEVSTPAVVAKGAVRHADALIAEIEREEKAGS